MQHSPERSTEELEVLMPHTIGIRIAGQVRTLGVAFSECEYHELLFIAAMFNSSRQIHWHRRQVQRAQRWRRRLRLGYAFGALVGAGAVAIWLGVFNVI